MTASRLGDVNRDGGAGAILRTIPSQSASPTVLRPSACRLRLAHARPPADVLPARWSQSLGRRANHIRFDLSPYLIHFFRKVDFSGKDDAALYLEDWGPGEIVEDDSVTAFFLLRNAIRLGRLWSTWSVRRGRRTIYGPDPAVCFTDMPVAAFIEAGIAREAKKEAMSPLALVLPKDLVHAAGALPAIYGLTNPPSLTRAVEGGPRIMSTSELPEPEQFRYVTLGTYGSVDWTHEREWRWPCRGVQPHPQNMPPPDGNDLPGLDLVFSGMGVIVSTQKQARKVIHDILVLRDQGAEGRYSFVVVAKDITSLADLRDPDHVQRTIAAATINLDPYLSMPNAERQRLLTDYDAALATIRNGRRPAFGLEHGGCWLWVTDATHRMTRALVLDGRIKINKSGRYLVDLPFALSLPLAEREKMTRRLAALLRKRFGLEATYHSVVGSHDPDGIPHFSIPPFENRMIFNFGSDEGGD